MNVQTPVAVMPMSDPAAYYDMSRVRPEVSEAMRKINELGPLFASRAKAVDDEASFPTANYKDLADNGFLGLSIPVEFGGWGFSMGEYAMVGGRDRQILRRDRADLQHAQLLHGLVAVHV